MSNGPVEAVEKFVEAWGDQDFDLMLDVCQTSWRMERNRAAKKEREMSIDHVPEWITQGQENVGYTARERLEAWFGGSNLTFGAVKGEPEEVEIEEFSDVMVDVPVEIYLKDQYGQTQATTRKVRVIQENMMGSPDPEGQWGVNPVSVMRVED